MTKMSKNQIIVFSQIIVFKNQIIQLKPTSFPSFSYNLNKKFVYVSLQLIQFKTNTLIIQALLMQTHIPGY